MQIEKTTPITFKAHIPKVLKEKLEIEVYRRNMPLDAFFKQVDNVESWGYETSSVGEVMKSQISKGLFLFNSFFAPLKKAALPNKENLLDSFMALTKKDIIDAQNSLKI